MNDELEAKTEIEDKIKLMELEHKMKISNRESWIKNISIIAILLIIGYLLIFSKITFDVTSLLSLILAFFSIGLSAQFYFKATEQSNNFYHNTFTFTKSISENLERIESKFGENLRYIESSSKDLNSKFDNLPKVLQETESNLIEKEQKVNEVEKKEKELLYEVINKLERNERNKYLSKIEQSEQEKKRLLDEVNKLKTLVDTLNENDRPIDHRKNNKGINKGVNYLQDFALKYYSALKNTDNKRNDIDRLLESYIGNYLNPYSKDWFEDAGIVKKIGNKYKLTDMGYHILSLMLEGKQKPDSAII